MAKAKPPIEQTKAIEILEFYKAYSIKTNTTPTIGGFWNVASKQFPQMTQGEYRYCFQRLTEEGLIVVIERGMFRVPSLKLVVNPDGMKEREKSLRRDLEYVYILGWGDGIYKIGLTNNLASRVAQIGILLPFEIKLVHKITTYYARRVERELHNKYAAQRLNGEWFRLSDQDIEDIKAMEFADGPTTQASQ